MTQGFGFGMGSSMGHRVIGSIFGSNNNSSSQNIPSTNHSTEHNHNIPSINHSTQYNQIPLDITNPKYISKNECKGLQEEYLNCLNNISPYNNCDFSLSIFKECEEAKY